MNEGVYKLNEDFTIELAADEYATNGSILSLGNNEILWGGRTRNFKVLPILNPVNGLCHVIFPEDAISGKNFPCKYISRGAFSLWLHASKNMFSEIKQPLKAHLDKQDM